MAPTIADPLEGRPVEELAPVEPADPHVAADPGLPADHYVTADPHVAADPGLPADHYVTTDPHVAADPGLPADPHVVADPNLPVDPGLPVDPDLAAGPPAATGPSPAPNPVEAELTEPQPREGPLGPVAGEDAHGATEPPIPSSPQARREALLERRARRSPIGGRSGQRTSGRRGERMQARRRPGDGAGGRRLSRARGGALLALAAAGVAVWFLLSLFQPFAGAGRGSVIVEIPKGSSSGTIGSILAHDGVVSSGFFFDLRALLEGKRGALHSGRFQLRRNMSYAAAIDALSKPPPAAIAVTVVIPEGYTRLQIASLTREDGLAGSYLAESKSSSQLNPTRYGAPRGTPDLEGFLFPATYDLEAGVPVGRLVAEQLVAFRQRFGSAEMRRARELHVTPYQLLTVASMIEREAQTAHDRPLIAAVIYNRLRRGMPLGIDATIYYAVERQTGIPTYTHELDEAQLHIDSPYNTRIHQGLPPTPISNPGLASIDAAAHPGHVSYLYYVAAADGCGEQAFSTTYAKFQTNVAAYDAAVKKNGGHPPSCKTK